VTLIGLLLCSIYNRVLITKTLFHADFHVHVQNGKSALYYAAREGHFLCVRALVKANANILLRDKVSRGSVE
jgi:ankyrin repeat protein